MPVNADISDLFFNQDVDHCSRFSRDGSWQGWNEAMLHDEAEAFLDALKRLGIEVPSVDELVKDFMDRV